MTVVDTDVFVWYLRGNARAAAAIEAASGVSVSVITYLELVQGARSKREAGWLRATLAGLDAKLVQVNELISASAMFYVERYFHSHRLEFPDALIAATAVSAGAPLLTGNSKHYRAVTELEVRPFRPN